MRFLPAAVRSGDERLAGELHDVKSSDFKGVVEACTLCDMCFLTKCPYVPPHDFDLDFPHLMLRYRAVRRKRARCRSRTANSPKPTATAKPPSTLPCGELGYGNRTMRGVLERVAGEHREAELPHYRVANATARAQKGSVTVNAEAPAYGQRKAVLYATCSMNYNDPISAGWRGKCSPSSASRPRLYIPPAAACLSLSKG